MTTCKRCNGSVGRFGYDQEEICLMCGWDQQELLTLAELKALQIAAMRQQWLVKRIEGRGASK